MARSIGEIQQEMTEAIRHDPVLSGAATSTSKTALWRLWTRIAATCAWTVEVLMDTFVQEVNEKVAALKPHSLRWYAAKAEAFQYGRALALDSDTYDNTNVPEETAESERIVKYAAVTERDAQLAVKVAKQSDDLMPLSEAELTAFRAYMNEIKDAGVKLSIVSHAADSLKLGLTIYYDPLILSSNGSRIDGASSTPVRDAITRFLQNLPFNGEFVIAYLTDALQQVDGVVIPHVAGCFTKYSDLPFTSVNISVVPESGYLRLADQDFAVTYIAKAPLR